MEKKDLVSIVIPVYKVAEYLPFCLDSIDRQTYKDLEVVLVDDGSPDNCGELCDNYASHRDNVKVIHQPNQGLSAARNSGAKESSGQYVTFLDSDDVVSDDYVETLYCLIKKNDADISVGLLVPFWGEKGATTKTNKESKINVYDTEHALEEMLYGQKYGVQGPDKLYKRDLVIDDPFPVGKLHEDQAAMYKIIAKCKKLVYINKPIYFYRQRTSSIVHTHVSKEHLYGLEAVKNQLDFIKKYYPSIVNAAEVRMAIVVCKWIPGLSGRSKEDREMFKFLRSELMPFYKSIIGNPRVTKALKARVMAVKCGFYPAKIIFSIIESLRVKKSENRVSSQE